MLFQTDRYLIFKQNVIQYILSFICFSFIGCNIKNHTPEQSSFYYWKTSYKLSAYEKTFLHDRHVKKIYLHCFDVVDKNNIAVPEGVLLWKDTLQPHIKYIPVVNIDNHLLSSADTATVRSLADKVMALCRQIFDTKKLPVDEIQIDCDWTKNSQTNYFFLLQYLTQQHLSVSATLRLYPYKYRNELGIPPVDFVSVMCYNMGNMKNENAENSILNLKDLEAYLSGKDSYPKPLNVALPLFGWNLLFRQHQLKGILYNAPALPSTKWKQFKDQSYICSENHYDSLCGQEFYRDDVLRIEQISKRDLNEALDLIRHHLKNTKNEIVYFDLDSNKIQYCPD